MMSNHTIRSQLEPHVRSVGLRHVARQVTKMGVRGVTVSALCDWLGERTKRRMKDHQIDAICRVLDLDLIIERDRL